MTKEVQPLDEDPRIRLFAALRKIKDGIFGRSMAGYSQEHAKLCREAVDPAIFDEVDNSHPHPALALLVQKGRKDYDTLVQICGREL